MMDDQIVFPGIEFLQDVKDAFVHNIPSYEWFHLKRSILLRGLELFAIKLSEAVSTR